MISVLGVKPSEIEFTEPFVLIEPIILKLRDETQMSFLNCVPQYSLSIWSKEQLSPCI